MSDIPIVEGAIQDRFWGKESQLDFPKAKVQLDYQDYLNQSELDQIIDELNEIWIAKRSSLKKFRILSIIPLVIAILLYQFF
jgi:hypothetical protein